MSTYTLKLEDHLIISPRPLLLFTFFSGVSCIVLAVIGSDLAVTLKLDALAGGMFLFSWAGWALEFRFPKIVRWSVALTYLMILFLPSLVFNLPPILPFLFVPAFLACMMLGFWPGLIVAGVETVMIYLIVPVNYPDHMMILFSVFGAWLSCIFYWWLSDSLRQMAHWSTNYLEKANLELKEVYDTRQQNAQTIKDLEDANLRLQALHRLTQNLRQLAENARIAKEQFVANVSHELRTPLNMITGYAEMILKTPGMYGRKIPGALLADLSVIQRNAEHLTRLINDVLDLSQIDVDQMALYKEKVNFAELLDFVMAAMQPLYKLKNLYLQCEIQTDMPVLFCDRTRLQEILLNILSNAGKFTQQGGVVICARKENGNLFVSIQDTGPGIAKENISRIFRPFDQIDTTIRRQYGGTGLGLSISKRFIEMHGGRIWVESEEGRGTTFCFTIPFDFLSSEAGEVSRWLNPHQVYETLDHLPQLPTRNMPRIMVLENGSVLANLLRRHMSQVEVIQTKNLAEALQQHKQYPAQLLLLNTYQADDILAKIGNEPEFGNGIPVIACSIPGMEDQEAAMGVSGVLVKPIAREQMLDLLDRIGITSGTILIVDDDPDATQLFARMLTSTKQDYQVLTARDGNEVLQLLQNYHPDAILLDLLMPNLNGFQLLEKRSENPELQEIPIILISAQNLSGHPIVCESLTIKKADGFSIRQLLNCIQGINRAISPLVPGGDPTQPVSLHD